MLQKAKKIADFINTFRPEPLKAEHVGFYQDTAHARNGKALEYHVRLFNRILMSTDTFRYLVLGHYGCGKSTELLFLQRDLDNERVPAILINIEKELDINSFTYIDVMVAVAEQLLSYAESRKISIPKSALHALNAAFSTRILSSSTDSSSNVELESLIEAGSGLPFLLKAVVNLRSAFRLSSGIKDDLRREFMPKISSIIEVLNVIIFEIKKHNTKQNHHLVIIMDGFEKNANIEHVSKFFSDGGPALSTLNAHLICTCPLTVYYSFDIGLIESYFDKLEIMPIIKVQERDLISKNKNLKKCDEGVRTLTELVNKRLTDGISFFEDGILEVLILKTGGSFRELFPALAEIGFRSYEYGKTTIDMDAVDEFSKERGRDLFLRVINNSKAIYLPIIRRIYEGNYDLEEDSRTLRNLYANYIVFEYNGERWCNLHPMFRDYIDAQKLRGIDVLEVHS